MDRLPSRQRLIDVVALHTCTRNCFGRAGLAGNFCTLEARDWIQGPVRDAAAVLDRLSGRFGRTVPFEEVFVAHAEGSELFPERSTWQNEANYPAIRPLDDPAAGYPCRYLDEKRMCGIYEDRPEMCRDYRCDHLQTVVDLL